MIGDAANELRVDHVESLTSNTCNSTYMCQRWKLSSNFERHQIVWTLHGEVDNQ